MSKGMGRGSGSSRRDRAAARGAAKECLWFLWWKRCKVRLRRAEGAGEMSDDRRKVALADLISIDDAKILVAKAVAAERAAIVDMVEAKAKAMYDMVLDCGCHH